LELNRKATLTILILVISIFLVYIFNIGAYDLWSPDEPRYAEVGREAAVDGHWVIPHLNNRIYYEKPPTYFNLIGLSGILAGEFSVTAVRMPGIIISVLLLLSLAYFVLKKDGLKTAVLSTIILATTINFFWLAMKINLDIPLVFCTTLAALILFKNHSDFKNNKLTTIFAFFLMGLGAVVKSPISILPLITLTVYLLINKKAKKLKEIPWLASLFFMVLPALIWLFFAYQKAGYSYFETTVLDQLVGYSTGSQGHPQPFYYYLINFPMVALPWSFFVVPALYYYKKLKNERNTLLDFSVVSFLVIFIVFSMIGSKRNVYLLQLYPFFAIIVGWFFKQHLNGKIKEKKSIIIPMLILIILFLTVGIYIYLNGEALIAEELDFQLNKNSSFFTLYQSLYFLFTGAGIVFLLSIFTKKRYMFGSLVMFSLILIIMLKTLFLPTLNTVKSERYLAEDLAAAYNESAEVGLWGSLNNDSGFVFYNGIYYDKIFSEAAEVREFINSEGNQILIINEAEKLYDNFKQNDYQGFKVNKYRVGSDDMLLLIENPLLTNSSLDSDNRMAEE
jgi:4-amino-4-deoxy-L-arabinose transferase-like glycosyltransferase